MSHQSSVERPDHRAFLTSLSAEERAGPTRKTNSHALLALAVHGSAVVTLAWLILRGTSGWPLLMVLHGITIIFLVTLLHETSHRTAFRSHWLNTLVARVCGFLVVVPAEWFRCFHFAHHRHTQYPARDPELAEAKPTSVPAYPVHVSGIPAWRSQVNTLVSHACRGCNAVNVPDSARRRVQREARISLALYLLLLGLSLALQSTALLHVWVLPIVLGQPFLRFYLLAEHGRCRFVANMFENTRATFTNALVRRLAWNMPFHAEHHCYPAVPFHRLPALHWNVRQHLQVTERGYARFNQTYLSALRPTRSGSGSGSGSARFACRSFLRCFFRTCRSTGAAIFFLRVPGVIHQLTCQPCLYNRRSGPFD